MHWLIAPDSFKETLTAGQAADAIARGIRHARPDVTCDLCPMADGGEGTVEALAAAMRGTLHTTCVTGPLGAPVNARWAVFPSPIDNHQSAIIEMASAAGLHLVSSDRRDPTRTTTFGVGQLIRAALDAGARHILLGLGGSATCDGGVGMAQALGYRFAGPPADALLSGGLLQHITAIDASSRDPRLDECDITVACDVTNPLCGPVGAAAVYAPQKGATPAQVAELDAGLQHLVTLCRREQICLRPSRDQLPGAGAAGGLGFGLRAFCGARLERGIELVMNAVDFDRRASAADLVVTGEGKLDRQSIHGKTCIGVAQRAARLHKRTIALVGRTDDGADACLAHGLSAYDAICDKHTGVTLDQAMRQPARYLEELARRVAWRMT